MWLVRGPPCRVMCDASGVFSGLNELRRRPARGVAAVNIGKGLPQMIIEKRFGRKRSRYACVLRMAQHGGRWA